MKKIILIALVLFAFTLFADEWINVNGKDYKLVRIDTEQGIVIADGYYDIVIEDEEVVSMTYLGGMGNYFFYTGENQNVTLTQEMIDSLTVQIYGEPVVEE